MAYGIMRYGIVRDITVRDGIVRYDTVRDGIVGVGIMAYYILRYGIVKYVMVSHNVLYLLTSSCSISFRIAGRSFPTSSSFRDCIFCSHWLNSTRTYSSESDVSSVSVSSVWRRSIGREEGNILKQEGKIRHIYNQREIGVTRGTFWSLSLRCSTLPLTLLRILASSSQRRLLASSLCCWSCICCSRSSSVCLSLWNSHKGGLAIYTATHRSSFPPNGLSHLERLVSPVLLRSWSSALRRSICSFSCCSTFSFSSSSLK